MISPASSEFIDLCQAQVYLLAQALRATSTVVYLADRSVGHSNPTLVPIVAYPELLHEWRPVDWNLSLAVGLLPSAEEMAFKGGTVPSAEVGSTLQFGLPQKTAVSELGFASSRWQAEDAELASEHQIVLPLAHEGIVLGVLVSIREDSPWRVEERQQAERVASTLTLARVMDQRGQWLEQRLQRKQLAQSYQSETMHDLLHQFRNPLTALRTFGKLLVKRMQSSDANQPIAEGIVRESERLQDLIQHFDEAVAVGDADLQESDEPPRAEVLALPASEQPLLPLPTSDSLNGSQLAAPGLHLGAVLTLTPVKFADILKPLLISADAVAQEKQIRVWGEIPPGLPPVLADPGALREVVSNLLDNALKYSPAGAMVWTRGGLLREESETSFQGLAIGDTGPGIPQADQAQIFQRHYRGVQARGEIPGTGLGLAIAHDLITEMGGQIHLLSPASLSGLVPESIDPKQAGLGTVFIIWLPQYSGGQGYPISTQ